MRKIFLALALAFAVNSASAQSDGFFNNWEDLNNRDMIGGSDVPNLPNTHGYGDDQDADAPIGSGLLVLTTLGVCYAATKRREER